MTARPDLRTALRDALVAYMRDDIRTFAFDDQNMDVLYVAKGEDKSLKKISEILWHFHDDFLDHPISVGESGWQVLRRIVAFLSTELELDEKADVHATFWPFCNEQEWQAHESLLRDRKLPDYDPLIHGQPIRSSMGEFGMRLQALLLPILGIGLITVAFLRGCN